MAIEQAQLVLRTRAKAMALGFDWVGAEPALFSALGRDVVPIGEMHEKGRRGTGPHVRVYTSPAEDGAWPSERVVRTTREDAHKRNARFVSLTLDGEDFVTYLARGDGFGYLSYLPPAVDAARHPGRVKSLRDAQPISSIAELRQLVSLLSDIIFEAHGHDRLRLFDTLLALLVAKAYDELAFPDHLSLPRLLAEGRPDMEEAVEALIREAARAFGCTGYAPRLDLGREPLRRVLAYLLRYSLRSTIELDSHAEVLGTFYQEVVSSTFRGSLGAYFTPKPVADLAAALCKPTATDTIFDISCGSGTFLLSGYRLAVGDAEQWSGGIFGCDIQERMVMTAVLNCLLHGVSRPHIYHGDGLKVDLPSWHSTAPDVPLSGFSLIVGNPPFAGFENHVQTEGMPADRQRGGDAPRVHKVIPFVDKVVDLLARNGRAILVIPTSVLNGEAQSFRGLRKRLSERTHVEAVVGLPREAFVHTDCGVEGALLLFRRVHPEEAARGHTFHWQLKSLGYDRRGRCCGGSDIPDLLSAWASAGTANRIPTEQLYGWDRWDATWLHAEMSGALSCTRGTHVPLTDLCTTARRTFSRRDIEHDHTYTYFEVGDTDIDTGEVLHTHTVCGAELVLKARLRQRVRAGDVLLPNHRDSLIAKTAKATGRSVVVVPEALDGLITTDRFTVLEPQINEKALVALLNSRLVRSQLAVHARGSASFDIREKVLREVWIPQTFLAADVTSRLAGLIDQRRALAEELAKVTAQIEETLSVDTDLKDTGPVVSATQP